MNQQVSEPTIVVRGDVPDQMIAYARDKLLGVLARTSMPVLAAELRLDHHADPARERPNHAEMTIDLDGVVVRARRSAPTMSEAIDRAEARFVHDETNAEAVVYREGDGYGLMQRVPTPAAIKQVKIPLDLGPHPATTTIENALTVLDETDAPFEFFVDGTRGRGMVAYRRYDGHYGLILPS